MRTQSRRRTVVAATVAYRFATRLRTGQPRAADSRVLRRHAVATTAVVVTATTATTAATAALAAAAARAAARAAAAAASTTAAARPRLAAAIAVAAAPLACRTEPGLGPCTEHFLRNRPLRLAEA